MLAFQSRNLNLGTESCLRERDGDHTVQIISLTFKEKMFLHVQNYVQVACRAAVKASLAVSPKANAGSIFHACRNLRVDRPLAKNPAFPFALGAGIGNNAARALAGGTGPRNTEKALLIA